MNYIFTFIFLFFFNAIAYAQTDTLSVFHNSLNSAQFSKEGNFKNALSFNLMQILRGGALLSYERLIGSSGLAINAGIGINKFDALGQIYFRELTYYYKMGTDVVKEGTKIKPLFDIGIKYYTNQAMGGSYIQTAFTSIFNTVNLQEFKSSEYINLPANFNHLDYRSNEFKCLVGVTNKNDKKFYNDFSMGIGYRFIQYDKYYNKVVNDQSGNNTVMFELAKSQNTNQTPWFYLSWKVGKRF